MPGYGDRLRIGYTSVAFVTEVLPIEFYRMAPDGVALSLLTMQQNALDAAELDRLYRQTLESARTFAEAEVDIIALGGRPVMMTRGLDSALAMLNELSATLGRPVISDATAQLEALRTLGARRIVTVHPFGPEEDGKHDDRIRALGFEAAGSYAGNSRLNALPRLPTETALGWAREAMNRFPDADTLLFPCPHWPVVDAIGPVEDEFGVTAVSNLQTTLWKALRTCGLTAPIKGYGRLLRDY